jgi:hypothetical protein
MEFTEHIRRPFKVEAVQITKDNIEEIASMIGELKTKGDEKFILLDKRIVPSMNRAYVGWWVTRFNDNLRCYSNKIFTEQFMPYTEEWNGWFDEVPSESEETPVISEHFTVA